MKNLISQIASLTLLASSAIIASASFLQWIDLDLPLALSLFTFAGAVEISRIQYQPVLVQPIPRLRPQRVGNPSVTRDQDPLTTREAA